MWCTVYALRGHSQAEDWTGRHHIEDGRNILREWPNWKIVHTSRDCNAVAHNVAKCAKNLNFCGPIAVDCVLP